MCTACGLERDEWLSHAVLLCPPPPLPPGVHCVIVHVMCPRGKQDAVASTRAKFLQPDGDQLTLLAVMRAYLEVDRRQRAEWASDNFINIR